MAKRSDFAQKLLDDLRVRKERMAASQSSKSSKPIAGDAYSYSKQTYRRSREMKTHQTTGLRNGSTHNRTAGSSKSFSIGEASKDIVLLGRGRTSEQIGDLSMALAFALENGGKLRRIESSANSSVLSFLNQIGRQSVGMGRMERSTVDRHEPATNRFPTLSHLHIKEISKGAEKLNQILRACSNGLNFDRYSIEIGNELLKGAMDLEESLRMLVNLQEASEYMISSQNKTRITLLDDDDDDDEDDTVKTDENKQLARPIFSFDKASRNSRYIQEAARSDLKQRLMTMTYRSETANFSQDAHNLSTSNSASHRRSASYSPNMKNFAENPTRKNPSSSSISKPEKGRIPNVIAKLMGLEELPVNDSTKNITKKESNSREKTEQTITKRTAERSIRHEPKSKDAGILASPTRKHKQIHSNQTRLIQNTIHGTQAERNLGSHQASFEGTIHDGKPPQKDMEDTKPMKRTNKANIKIDNQQNNRRQSSQSIGSRKDTHEKERKQDTIKLGEQKGYEKGETKELFLKHHLHQTALRKQNGSETATAPAEGNTTLKTERRDAHRISSNNQLRPLNSHVIQQPQMPQTFESLKHYAGENEKLSVKQKIQIERQEGSESRSSPKPTNDSTNFPQKHSLANQPTPSNRSSTESISTMQSLGISSKRHHEDFVWNTISPTLNDNKQNSVNNDSNHKSSTRVHNPQTEEEKTKFIIPPEMEEEPVHTPSVRKVNVLPSQKPEALRKIDEVVARKRANPQNMSRTMKSQTSTLQEVKHRRQYKLGRSREEEQVRSSRPAEAHILKSNRSVPSTQQSYMLGELQNQAEQPSNFCSSPAVDQHQCLKVPEIRAPNENSSRMIDSEQGQDHDFGINKHSSGNIVVDSLDGIHGARIRNKKASILETVEPLTESENHLKQILIKSQLFLNTAEALFKLNIPSDIFQSGGHDEESKLVLDCGYEVMKRKGKRQELSLHPFIRISITCVKVRSLEALIRQLHKDFDKLKFYGRNGKTECGVEDYLPKMLEIDVSGKDPDVNCMWDFGWHEAMFTSTEKDVVVRDVEKHLLNGLLDEITRDLLLLFPSSN